MEPWLAVESEAQQQGRSCMKRNVLTTALASAGLCLALAAPVAASDPRVPFGGRVAGPDSYGSPSDCPAGASWHYTSLGEGELLHLGRVTIAVSHCTWDDVATLSGHFGPGTMTFTAANGDQLVLADSGTYTLDLVALKAYPTGSWVVVSGTGRFARASGSGTFGGVSDLVAGVSSMRYWGSISY